MNHENQQTSFAWFETMDPAAESRLGEATLEMRKAIVPSLLPLMRGRALCVGWSSMLRLTPPKADLFVLVDFSKNSIARVPKRSNVATALAEASKLPFDRGTFDTVLLPDILHHLTEDNNHETDRYIAGVMSEASRVLNRDGRLYILEAMPNTAIETLISMFYFPVRMLMNAKGYPMMRFTSVESMRELCREARLDVVSVRPIQYDGPAFLSSMFMSKTIPYKYLPQKLYLAECRKVL